MFGLAYIVSRYTENSQTTLQILIVAKFINS